MKSLCTLLFITFYISNLVAQIDLLPYREFRAGNWAEVLCIGDINNDSINEVVVGTRFGSSSSRYSAIEIFTQDGNDGLDSSGVYTTSTHSFIEGIEIGDINDDGLNDVVIGYDDHVGYFLQNINGQLNAMQSMFSGKGVNGLRLTDLNNDGLTDIVASHRQATFIRVFYQNNTGFSPSNYPKPQGGQDEIEVGDVNSDGLTDVVYMTGYMNYGVHVFTQNPAGGLSNYVYYPFSSGSFSRTNGLALGDLNQDGSTDIVTTKGGNTPTSGILLWYQDTASGTLTTPPIEVPAYDIPQPVEIADLDCNGINEIITVHGGWHALSIFEQSNGNFGPYAIKPLPYASHYQPQGLEIGDINSDGLEDIAIAEYNQGLIVLLNNSRPTNTTYDSTSLVSSIDTFSTSYHTLDSMVFVTSVDTTGSYLLVTTDSFKLEMHYRIDSLQYDSISIVATTLCGNPIFDSLKSTVYTSYQRIVQIDSTHTHNSTTTVNPFKAIAIYPNPTASEVYIELPSPYDRLPINLSIHDVHGALLHYDTWTGTDNMRKLNFSDYPDAVYLLVLSTGDFVISRRIIKRAEN